MTTEISLPSALAKHTGGNSTISAPVNSLGEALSHLTEQFSLGEVLLAEDGSLQPYIRVVIDNTVVKKSALNNLAQIDVTDKQIELKTAFAGG